jgi:hypothetical protein
MLSRSHGVLSDKLLFDKAWPLYFNELPQVSFSYEIDEFGWRARAYQL